LFRELPGAGNYRFGSRRWTIRAINAGTAFDMLCFGGIVGAANPRRMRKWNRVALPNAIPLNPFENAPLVLSDHVAFVFSFSNATFSVWKIEGCAVIRVHIILGHN
jgi:hypothetical protein